MCFSLTISEVAQIIERVIDGTCGAWDWDDFISFPLQNPALEEIRAESAELAERYPPTAKGWYCSQAGLDELRRALELQHLNLRTIAQRAGADSMRTLKASLIASAIGTGAWLLGLARMMWPEHPQGAVFFLTVAATFVLMFVLPERRR